MKEEMKFFESEFDGLFNLDSILRFDLEGDDASEIYAEDITGKMRHLASIPATFVDDEGELQYFSYDLRRDFFKALVGIILRLHGSKFTTEIISWEEIDEITWDIFLKKIKEEKKSMQFEKT